MSKRTIKVLALFVCMMFVLTSFVACGSTPASDTSKSSTTEKTTEKEAPKTAEKASEVKKPKVGVLWDFLQVERRVKSKDSLEAESKKYGFNMIFQNANGDEKLQLQQAENLITQKVDLIVILPQNGDAAAPIIEQAHKAGIKVIAFDRMIANSDLDLFVGMDNDVIGDLMAGYVYKLAPKGNYALVSGAPTDPNVPVYKAGWMRVIKPAIDKGDIKIVSDTQAEKWDPLNAMKNVENFLTKFNDKIDVILAMNDGTGGGSIQALKARNLNGKVLVTGQDGELAACQRIVEGDQAMTVWKPDDQLATVLAKTIMDVIANKPVDTQKTINNGKKDVPSVLFTPIVVDKNNMMDTIIKSKYHKMEDVYKNVPKDKWPQQ